MSWYETFFTELPNEFWRRAVPAEGTAAEIEFIERHLDLTPNARIVDVPCGSGRHSLALAERGYRVTGVDVSPEAVGYARRAAAAAGLSVELSVADMRDIPGGGFDAAVCLGNSFGYLNYAGTKQFVAALATAVRPGGGLVIDFAATAESILPGYRSEPRTMTTGDITVETTSKYDADGSRSISEYRFTQGVKELTATAVHHVYTSAHLGNLLVEGGFGDIRRFGGTGDEPFELGSPRLLLTAVREDR